VNNVPYTVRQLADLAGVSPRTLRYYDQIGLLKPGATSEAGYRLYGAAEVDRLQQILFYRELGFGLEQIRRMLSDPAFDSLNALREHRRRLLAQRERLDTLIANVNKTIAAKEGRATMTDRERFEGFKKRMIEENEQKYGREARAKYGDDIVDQSNAKLMNMTPEQCEELKRLEADVLETLAAAFRTGDAAGELAQKAADLHRQWLMFFWPKYDAEAHANLAQMYVDDDRFKAYYEKEPGMTEFLRDAIKIYAGSAGAADG
jgi:DNA-binding transcriptional MerR regulator